MPNDDVTHPVPDLTGYITEGQIVLDRSLDSSGTYPPVSVLPSLSRLMKDGIGAGYTREDHSALSNQLLPLMQKLWTRVLWLRLSVKRNFPHRQKYIEFGKLFESQFVNQGSNENRSIDQSLDLGWKLLSTLPREELDRVDSAILDKYYEKAKEQDSSAEKQKKKKAVKSNCCYHVFLFILSALYCTIFTS